MLFTYWGAQHGQIRSGQKKHHEAKIEKVEPLPDGSCRVWLTKVAGAHGKCEIIISEAEMTRISNRMVFAKIVETPEMLEKAKHVTELMGQCMPKPTNQP